MVGLASERGLRYAVLSYLSLCVILAGVAFLPAQTTYLPFTILFLITLPVSVIATAVSYIVGVLLFGPEGLSLRLFNLVVWIMAAGLQSALCMATIRSRRARGSSRGGT